MKKEEHKDSEIGIYKIENKVNGKVYIGQSRTLKRRISHHKNALSKNKHDNIHLQSAYNKYGKDNFIFEIIEKCNLEELHKIESKWINHYNSNIREYGYNITMPNENDEVSKIAEETKIKLSEAKIVYTKEELISYLHEYFYHYGKVPTQRDLDKVENFPKHVVYFERFGSFKNALIEAGLYDFVEVKSAFDRKEYTKREVINKFKKFIDKYGRFPNHIELKETIKNDLVSTNAILKHFSSIEDLKITVGLGKEVTLEIEKEEAINSLIKLYEKEGYVTSRTVDKSNITRSVKFYANNFGSLLKAYELAGIYTKESILNELFEFYKVNNFLPIQADSHLKYKVPPYNVVRCYYTKQELQSIISKKILKEAE